MAQHRAPAAPDELLSRQVSGSRYFFLNLTATRGARSGLALGGREHCNPDYHLDRRRYAYYVLEYVAEGAGWAELDGKRTELGPGALFAARPTTHCVLHADPSRPLVKYFVCVSGRGFEADLRRARLGACRVARVAAHGELRNVFEELLREGGRGGERSGEICQRLLEILLLKIAEALRHPAGAGDVARENFLRCKALIDAQPERAASLEEVARAVALDVSSICRLFRRFQGTSPYQYLLRAKMNLAAERLLRPGARVKEVAQSVGFADPYHFSRRFKAVHGVAPRDLQRSRK